MVMNCKSVMLPASVSDGTIELSLSLCDGAMIALEGIRPPMITAVDDSSRLLEEMTPTIRKFLR